MLAYLMNNKSITINHGTGLSQENNEVIKKPQNLNVYEKIISPCGL